MDMERVMLCFLYHAAVAGALRTDVINAFIIFLNVFVKCKQKYSGLKFLQKERLIYLFICWLNISIECTSRCRCVHEGEHGHTRLMHKLHMKKMEVLPCKMG